MDKVATEVAKRIKGHRLPHDSLASFASQDQYNQVSLFAGSIMAVPKRKHSNSRTGKRRAHDAKKPKQLSFCPKCSTAIPTHVVCPNCGFYMGRTVVQVSDQ